jgi:hypothetical protein
MSTVPTPSSAADLPTKVIATQTLEPTHTLTLQARLTEVPIQTQPQEGTDMLPALQEIPSGNPPTLDGTHSSGEWHNAHVETFADGSQLYLIQAGDYLYLGIEAVDPGMIAGNVFLQRDDEISVLHSSAALGTATYQKSEADWKKIQDFNWRCRNTGNSESARAERVEFLEQEGWVAANGNMGKPNELEYQLLIPDQEFRLAVVFTRSTYPYEKVPWPADLDDDCIAPTPGGFPPFLKFSPDRWGTLHLTGSD